MEFESTYLSEPLLTFLKQQPEVKEIVVPAGMPVCQSGDRCQSLVIVLKGRVKVYRPAANGRSLTLYHINDNESCILTASCILNDMPFPAFAETTAEVKGLSIPLVLVKRWLEEEPLWQRYLFGLLSHRMAELIELVNALAFEGLDSRLAKWLMEQDNSCRNQSLGDCLIRTTHQCIAEELASSREVISRLLKEFESEGAIKIGRGTIQVLQRSKLENLGVV